MRVLLKRPLWLGGVLYPNDPRGVELPGEVDGKKVVLFSKEFRKQKREYNKEVAAQGYSDVEVAENEIVLPHDAEEYKAEGGQVGPTDKDFFGKTRPGPKGEPIEFHGPPANLGPGMATDVAPAQVPKGPSVTPGTGHNVLHQSGDPTQPPTKTNQPPPQPRK